MEGMPGTPTGKSDTKIKKKIQSAAEVFKKYYDKGGSGKIDMDIFAKEGIYSPEIVANDKRRVEKLKASEEYSPTNAGIVLENIINDLGESNCWFSDAEGENENYCILLSEYDDMMKESATADLALEIKTPDGKIIRLLIDLTTSVDYKNLYEKRRKCLEKIQEGQLHSVKYFQSQLTDEMGRLNDVPMVIAGINKDSLNKLCERAGKSNDLSKDYVAFMLLDEIVEQLKVFSATSIQVNGADHFVTEKLSEAVEVFSEIRDTKNSLRPRDFREKAGNDTVYDAIMNP